MLNSCFFIGEPLQFANICKIYPPTVKDMIAQNGLQYAKLLTYSDDDLEDMFAKQLKEKPDLKIPNPLQFLLINSFNNEEFKIKLEESFKFFTHKKITFLFEQQSILIGNDEDLSKINDLNTLPIINNDNFLDFQNMIREAVGQKIYIPPKEETDPEIARIKAAGRRRDRAARRKRNRTGNEISLTTYLAAICCMGIGLTPLNIGEISYASVNILIRMYQGKEKYDTDVASILAGADSKKIKPRYWIHEDESEFHEITI